MQNTRPNLIWIITDQQRYDAIGMNDNATIRTPVLDMLAREGVNYRNAYAGFPLCCPARGTILTSVYPHKCVRGHQCAIPDGQKTVADAFAAHGYDTFYLGKWHVAGAKEEELTIPIGQYIVPREKRGGFAAWLGYENNNAQYDCWLHGHRNEQEVELFRLPAYETDALTDLFIEEIERRASDTRPFFGVLSVQPPHDPYVAPFSGQFYHNAADIELPAGVPDVAHIREQARREYAGYCSMIENIDMNVGRVVQALQSNGLLEHTHIMFFSDHGDMHGAHGQFRKMTAYQESVHVPLIIAGEKRGGYYWDRNTGPSDVLVNHVDLAPTSLGLCGLPVPEWMQGRDLSWTRVLDRLPQTPPASVYLQSVIPTGHFDSVDKPWRGLVTADGYKYVAFPHQDWLLFDLNTDPLEQVNLAHNPRFAELRQRLREELKKWVQSTEDEFPVP